ncbi:hypothetical protein B0H14DRAFT_2619080 [Mycena olivaceomarginata]|nr:hypothetical protein B0H14DRAFT_2619080 [Mycena olivaceomarginata]
MELDNSIEKPRLQGSCRVAGECDKGCVQRQGAAGAPKEWVCGAGLQTNHDGSAHPLVIGRVLAVAEGRLRGVGGVEENELRCEGGGHSVFTIALSPTVAVAAARRAGNRRRTVADSMIGQHRGVAQNPFLPHSVIRDKCRVLPDMKERKERRQRPVGKCQDVKNGITAAAAPESGPAGFLNKIVPGGGVMSMWNRALEKRSTVLALAGTTGKQRYLYRVSTWFRVKI